uniref:RCR-type E3 ubiquitin transferase n=1 Tax=Anopheles dirus TaxID=7168 RepID=A0A182N2D5_9DIPT
EKNYEKQFLRDFIYVAAGSPGARLAAWLQPESRLDPSRCEIKIISPQTPPLRAGWPSHFRLETRDQYGEEIFVPGIKIEVKASLRRDTSVNAITPKVSPGTPTAAPPSVPYEPTYKEKEKSCLQAISAMRPYHGYSFEELRLYAANMSSTSTSTTATTEILTANDLGKNKYGFVWTPMVAGAYELTLQIDGVPVVVEDEEEIYRLEVIDAGGAGGGTCAGGSGASGGLPKTLGGEKGMPGGGQGLKKVHPPTKLRKFLAKNSAGLRVRLHPTLQSEQIGVVRPNGIVAYGDELENDDGVWVRLTAESIREHCPASWFPVEAWCLQYNQHLGKTLLHPIVDTCSTKVLLEHTTAKEEPSVADTVEDIEADDCEGDGEENENTINYGDFRKAATAALSEVVGGGAKALQKWFHRSGTEGSLMDDPTQIKSSHLQTSALLNQQQQQQQQPTAQQGQTQQQQDLQQQSFQQHLPKRALSPSVAETLRAVFAAFLWHEGLVHDAMACASFLKFHPTISKTAGIGVGTGPMGLGNPSAELPMPAALTREQKVLQRHSVEFSNATLDALERSGNRCIMNRRHRGIGGGFGGVLEGNGATSSVGSNAVPPVALRCLVHLWDQLGSNFVQLVETNSNDKRNDDGHGAKESPPVPGPGSGTGAAIPPSGGASLAASKSGLTLAASTGTVTGASTTAATNGAAAADGSYCELCRTVLHSIPVTYHMRLAHPGCGRPAGGQGYNSNGVYCEGWAGDCGDGGHGVSSWYLLCEACRKRYEGTTPVPVPVGSQATLSAAAERRNEPPRSTLPSELFAMMKENAFFLLDLAPVESSACSSTATGTNEASLTEVTDASEWPAPPDRPACLGTFVDSEPVQPSAARFPSDSGTGSFLPLSGGKFHRSVSMGQGAGPSVVLRRRQRREDERSDANLLNHPSENLRRLVPLEVGTLNGGVVVEANGSGSTAGLLGRPAMVFILERHNLERLRRLLIRQLRRSLCHRYSLQGFNWLLRQLTEPIGLHDVMWWFVSALTASDTDVDPTDADSELGLEHPASSCEGHLGRGISRALHAFLSTVSELTLHFPLGSPLQRIAVQCFGLRFVPSDHQFLHRVNVFGNISRILSKSEEEEERALEAQSVRDHLLGVTDEAPIEVTLFQDITDMYELTVSSRPALAQALLDNSTETFWESDEEDRGKPKTIELMPGGRAGSAAPGAGCQLALIAVHVDNSRDVACKVTSLLLYGGAQINNLTGAGELSLLRTIEIDPAACAWQTVPISTSTNTNSTGSGHYRLEIRGPDATLRIRQVKLYGSRSGNPATSVMAPNLPTLPTPRQVQSRMCEQETLRVFRLLTGQVFGKLLEETSALLGNAANNANGAGAGSNGTGGNVNGSAGDGCNAELSPLPSLSESIHDLREHAVGILFSRRKLSHLQKQIIVHVVQAIERETVKARDAWESLLNGEVSTATIYNDAYCFEMLSMVLALSGSSVGRTYLSQQHHLLKDLLSLAHTGSDRVQRQVTALIRRILPELPSDTVPHTHADNAAVHHPSVDTDSEALLDVLLALIAKSLQVQVKVKNGTNGHQTQQQQQQQQQVSSHMAPSSLATTVVSLASVTPSSSQILTTGTGSVSRLQRHRWYLRGSIAAKQAESIIALVRDMASGKLSDRWATACRAAVASCLLNVTQLEEEFRRSADACIRTATLWLAMAALCVIDREQIDRLSSNQWHRQSESNRPLCSNHDDEVTYAVLNCALCGSLCADCDRVLHLNRRTRNHHRAVCKEEQDAIRVELHESCGRAKLYWLWAVVDSRTLKGMLEFRGHDPSAGCSTVPVTATGVGVCRFCGATGSSGLLALGNICPDAQCQEYGAVSCTRVHPRCGHACGGIINESQCLPCLVPNCQSENDPGQYGAGGGQPRLTQDGEDMCMICFTETLGTAPSTQLRCGHVFHYHCCKTVLMRRWNGPRISFGFAQCPICKVDIEHPSLEPFLAPIVALRQDVKRKALMRQV